MRLTRSLYVRNLLAALHPPLPPPSARESKQLLNVLEAAFQKHLDESHPSPQALRVDESVNEQGSIPDPAQRVTHSAHSHLDTILSHPLLRRKSTTVAPSRGLTAAAVSAFDDALIQTGLDFHLVQSCAIQYLQGLEKEEVVSDDGKLGPRLASWFTAMRNTDKKEFLVNGNSLASIVPVMYADGLEVEVWEWLRTLYERPFDRSIFLLSDISAPGALDYLRAEDTLVALMMKESIRKGLFHEAAQQYVHACEYRLSTGRAILSEAGLLSNPFKRAWQHIARGILLRRKSHQIEPELFDSMLKFGLTINSSPFDHAILRIYHPTSPSAQLWSVKVKEVPFQQRFSHWQKKLNKPVQRALLVAMLDAAQLSLEQNRPTEARDFLDFAELNYPDIVSSKAQSNTVERLRLARKEASTRKETRYMPALALV
ncbi:hypothetical protein A1O1_04691 [Capronia coronata CBS 617.96]|uniref:Uncharacterized protein n=1 Tax=Capronia coronata CBS 617.96 TaxID=1182541 RepID=W9YZP1_9EURO|nr:uncharacterized protein A1O1_04691 [Capronia coronata CBS 617.96]EXJ87764.1 hypothetical protein A1O1_04691 [Capronia coronata CBS 617.96]